MNRQDRNLSHVLESLVATARRQMGYRTTDVKIWLVYTILPSERLTRKEGKADIVAIGRL